MAKATKTTTKGTAVGKKTVAGKNGGTLKPAAPGEVRNPNGRGKGRLNNKTIIARLINEPFKQKNPMTGQQETLSVWEWINIALLGKAMKGDHKAYKELMDRLEGRSPQSMIITGEEGKPVVMDIKGLDNTELKQLLTLKRKMQKADKGDGSN